MSFLDPFMLDAADGNHEANKEHEGDDGEDKRKVRQICRQPEAVTSHNGRRADPADVKEIPDSSSAEGGYQQDSRAEHQEVKDCRTDEGEGQLEGAIPNVPQIELIHSKETKEEGQHKRSRLGLPLGAALGISKITIALAESQLLGPWSHAVYQVIPIPASAMTAALQSSADIWIAA